MDTQCHKGVLDSCKLGIWTYLLYFYCVILLDQEFWIRPLNRLWLVLEPDYKYEHINFLFVSFGLTELISCMQLLFKFVFKLICVWWEIYFTNNYQHSKYFTVQINVAFMLLMLLFCYTEFRLKLKMSCMLTIGGPSCTSTFKHARNRIFEHLWPIFIALRNPANKIMVLSVCRVWIYCEECMNCNQFGKCSKQPCAVFRRRTLLS